MIRIYIAAMYSVTPVYFIYTLQLLYWILQQQCRRNVFLLSRRGGPHFPRAPLYGLWDKEVLFHARLFFSLLVSPFLSSKVILWWTRADVFKYTYICIYSDSFQLFSLYYFMSVWVTWYDAICKATCYFIQECSCIFTKNIFHPYVKSKYDFIRASFNDFLSNAGLIR
jgi:hypothetical protein